MWTCPHCGSKVDTSFEICWNCGTSLDGVLDPTFVKADDADLIENPPVIPELDIAEDVATVGELPEPITGELVEAYRALNLVEAQFLTDQLKQAGIQAASDTHDMHEALGGVNSGPRVWVREEDLPRARIWLEAFDRNKVVPDF